MKKIIIVLMLLLFSGFSAYATTPKSVVFCVHGWGNDKRMLQKVCDVLAARESGLAHTFDLPGHGDAPGDRNQLPPQVYVSAFEKEYDTVVTGLEAKPRKITVACISLGCYITMLMLPLRHFDTLLLIAPATYEDWLYAKNKPFSVAISQSSVLRAWRRTIADCTHNKAVSALCEFTGKKFIFSGGQDKSVPPETLQKMATVAQCILLTMAEQKHVPDWNVLIAKINEALSLGKVSLHMAP